tara:strand:- start:167 stop:541 length:375 start_codon:yes stop_codon:yes gene_type:complete
MKYFDYEEFDSPDEIGSGLPTTDGGKMNVNFLHKLDEARAISGVPYKITSGYRTPKHNAKVGGRVGSSHLKGVAVDIKCNNSNDRARILKGLFLVGLGRRIGIATQFIHVDADYDKPSAIWLYQ